MEKTESKSLDSISKLLTLSFENLPISSIKKVPKIPNEDRENPKINPNPKKSSLEQLIKSSENQNFNENSKMHFKSDPPKNNKNNENDENPPKTTEIEHPTNFIERSDGDGGGSFTFEEPEEDPELERKFNEAETKLKRKAVQIIEAYEKEKKYIQDSWASYCILEDLVIWKSFPNERNDVWKKLGNSIFLSKRSLNSIRDRYRFYLQNLDKRNYLEILNFLEKLPNLDLRNYCLLFKNNVFQRITELKRGKSERNNAKYRFNASHIIEKREGLKFDNDDDPFDFDGERLVVNKEETKNMRNDGKFEERKGVENATNKAKTNNYLKPVLRKSTGNILHDENQEDDYRTGFGNMEEKSHSVFRKQIIVQKDEQNDAKYKNVENTALNQDLKKHHESNKNTALNQDLKKHHDQLLNKKDLPPVDLSLVAAEKPSNLEKTSENKEKKDPSNLKRKESPVALTKNDGLTGLKPPEKDKTITSERIVEILPKWCNCPHLPEIYSNSILENVSEKLKHLEKDKVIEEIFFFNMVIILPENAKEKKIIKTRQNLTGNAMSKINELSVSHKKSVEELLTILDSLNGNIEDLEIFLTGEMKNKSMVWHEEEDNLLRSLVSKNSLEFRILQRYKEIERIKTRAKFLNLHLPFEL